MLVIVLRRSTPYSADASDAGIGERELLQSSVLTGISGWGRGGGGKSSEDDVGGGNSNDEGGGGGGRGSG